MAPIERLREAMEKSVHEYLMARGMLSKTFPSGYGNIKVNYKLTFDAGRPKFLTSSEEVEGTRKA